MRALLLLLLGAAEGSTPLPRTWSNRLGSVLTPLARGVWAAERPFLWNGVDVGGRCVLLRLAGGGLLAHSPVDWTPALLEAVAALGPVTHVLSPNYEHLKYASQSAQAFPKARMLGCPGLSERVPDVAWTEITTSAALPDGLAQSLECLHLDCEVNPFTGRPFFNEVLLLHRPSRTLLCTDAYWNYPASALPNHSGEEGTGEVHQCSLVPVQETLLPAAPVSLGTAAWKAGMDRVYLPFYKRAMVGGGARRARYLAAVRTVLDDWRPLLIAPCHGDVVRGERLCREVLSKHFEL